MIKRSSSPRSSPARRPAISGALITGSAGIIMAVYSVAVGAQTSGGALLAASALAFGLLAANVGRGFRGSASTESGVTPGMQRSAGPNGGGPADPYREAVAREAVAPIEADPITDREREVLSLVAEGNSNKKSAPN